MKRTMNWLGGLLVLAVALTMVSCEALSNLAGGTTQSSNANLAGLDVTPGTLVPAFSANVTSYTVSGLAGTDTEILIDATAADAKASVTGAGVYDLSPTTTNKFKVNVKAEDGTSKVYNISATLPATAAVALSNLTVNGTTVAGFSPAVKNYQMTVASDVTSVVLGATAADATATVTGIGTKSVAIGANTFDIVVSKGIQSSSYSIVVNRPAPAGGIDLSLSSLTVNGTPITLVPGQFAYEITVPSDTYNATVVATATSGSVTVMNPMVQPLSFGPNLVAVLLKVDGNIVAAYTITITLDASDIPVSAFVQAGLDALKVQDYATAKNQFASALVADPTDNTAKLWASLLDLASIQTDPVLVDLFRTRLGVTGYPADLNSYMAGTWFNENYYASKAGFVPAPSDWQTSNYSVYVRGTFTPGTGVGSQSYWYYDPSNGYNDSINGYGTFTVNSSGNQYVYSYGNMHPTSVPRYYRSYNLTDLTSFTALPALNKPAMFQQADASGLQASEYPMILMANILSNNPTGFNGLIDTVVAKMDFSTVETRLNSLSDTDRVVIPADLIGYSNANGPEVSLSRNELRLLVASLKILKGFALYLQSENLDLPLSSFNSSWGKLTYAPQARVDANGNGIDDKTDAFYANAPGFRTSTFLTSRTDGADKRSASKLEFIGAVEQIQSAASGLKAAWLDTNSYYRGWLVFDPATDAQYQAKIDAVTSRLADVVTGAGNLLAALNNGSSIYVNVSNPGVNDVLGSWITFPASADTTPSTLTRVVPNALWDNNFLDPRKWLEKNGDGTFKTYLRVTGYSWSGNVSPTFLTPSMPAAGVALTASDFGIANYVSEVTVLPSAGVDLGLVNTLLPDGTFPTGLTLTLPGDGYQFYSNNTVVQATVPSAQYQKTDWLNR